MAESSAPASLKGQAIVVMGGTTGMGLAAAHAFVQADASLLIVGKTHADTTAAQAALGPDIPAIAADAVDPDTPEAVIRLAVETYGRLDGLFHVAGGSGRQMGDGPLHDLSDDGWRFTLDLNLTSIMRSNRAAVRQFLKQGDGGSILNMGSVLGFSPSPEYFATHAYATAKAAIIGFSRAVASYYARHNIRVNVLAPALIETPMSQRAANDERVLAFIRSKQPLDGGRIGEADDITGAAVYFLSDASRFVTGQVLAIDGGWAVSDGQHGAL